MDGRLNAMMSFYAGHIRAILMESVADYGESYTKRFLDGCLVSISSKGIFAFKVDGADAYAAPAMWYLSKCMRYNEIKSVVAATDESIKNAFPDFEGKFDLKRLEGSARYLGIQRGYFCGNKASRFNILTRKSGSIFFS